MIFTIFTYLVTTKIKVDQLIYRTITDQSLARDMIAVKRQLVRDISFLQHKMDGRSIMPYTSNDIFRHHFMTTVRNDFESHLRNGLDYNTAVQQPDMIIWFRLIKQHDLLLFRNVSFRDLLIVHEETTTSIPYGEARDIEMLHDYLLNWMRDTDAIEFCIIAAQYTSGL